MSNGKKKTPLCSEDSDTTSLVEEIEPKTETERKLPEWKLKEEYMKKDGVVSYINWNQVR